MDISRQRNIKVKLLKLLSKNIYQRRTKIGLSQEELSKKSGVGVKAISLIENGDQCPNIYSLASISEALNIPLGDLFT